MGWPIGRANGSPTAPRRDACEKAISTESVYNDIRAVGAAELAGGIGPKGGSSTSRRGLLLELGCTTCALYTKAVARALCAPTPFPEPCCTPHAGAVTDALPRT